MKYLISIIFILSMIISSFGQRPVREKIADKIESHKIAFITEALDLTPEESQKFWPLYNEYSAKERELRPEFKERPKALSEAEANEIIGKFFENEEKRLMLMKNYYQKFKMVIPASKVVKLHFAERKFKEKLLEKMKERRDASPMRK
ncbi:MAG: hypothetical protein ACM3PT_05130 [Deltaproteobacteria bacterium]